MASTDDNSDAPSPPVSGRLTQPGALTPSVLELLAELDAVRDENTRLVEALSAERRASLRLQREQEDVISQLQDALGRLRGESSELAPEEQPPRHSWIARREPTQPTADTVRPPPITAKR